MTTAGVNFKVEGSRLNGRILSPILPKGENRPAVLLLHGIPGLEQNWDVAYAIRELGWHCLIFHYRGAWGSEGRYSLPGLPTDVGAAYDFLANHEAVDSNSIFLIGHSLGGYLALRESLTNRARWQAVIALAPYMACEQAILDLCPGISSYLATTAEDLAQEFKEAPSIESIAASQAPSTENPLPVLVITATEDLIFPPDYYERHLSCLLNPATQTTTEGKADPEESPNRPSPSAPEGTSAGNVTVSQVALNDNHEIGSNRDKLVSEILLFLTLGAGGEQHREPARPDTVI